MGGEPRVLIQFLSLKTPPNRNNNIVNVVSPESLAYQRTKCISFPKDQSYCQSVLQYDLSKTQVDPDSMKGFIQKIATIFKDFSRIT